MGRFYESVFYDSPPDGPLLGWQLLASPHEINGRRISYGELLNDIGNLTPVDELGGLRDVFLRIGDPTFLGKPVVIHRGMRGARIESERSYSLSSAYITSLMDAPVFAAETSPLNATSVSRLAELATTTGVAVINGHAALILVGTRLGLVVIRGLGATGGALWEGSRPEIVDFSGDVTASLLVALRRRLGIKSRPANQRKLR
jgi:hypothetical protein